MILCVVTVCIVITTLKDGKVWIPLCVVNLFQDFPTPTHAWKIRSSCVADLRGGIYMHVTHSMPFWLFI